MFRLIWAELKKILLNKKTIIAISATLVIFIGLMTYAYYDSNIYTNYNTNQSYESQNYNKGAIGSEVVITKTALIDTIISETNGKIAELDVLKNADLKDLIKTK